VESPPLHPDLEPLGFLLGTWSGTGFGQYPTIHPFRYEETVTFSHVGKPFLVYSQRSTHAADGRLLHGESGFWRMPGPGSVELVAAHPNGIVEISEGELDGRAVRVRSTLVGCTTTAKDVRSIERRLVVEGGVLRSSLAMAAVGQVVTNHLVAELRRND
jgi:hypothetical protein